MLDQNTPQVLPDLRVTFHIYAPKASEVSIKGDWVSHGRGIDGPLQKDDKGVWFITVGPLVPDFYTYLLTVDGVATLDPENPHIKQSSDVRENILSGQVHLLRHIQRGHRRPKG